MISIGFVGEQYARSPIIDISEYLVRWPGSFPQLFVQRPNENEAYIASVSLNRENGTIVWEVNAYDTAVEGRGRAQLVFTKSETDKTIVGKSPVIQTYVQKSLEGTGEAEIPDPYETWVATISGFAENAAASAAISGNKASESAQSASEASAQANNARQYATSAKESAERSQDNRAATESARDAAHDDSVAAGNAAGRAETAKVGAVEAGEIATGAAARAASSAESAEGSARSSRDAKTASQEASTAASEARDEAHNYSTTAETASNAAEAAKRTAEECAISAGQSKEVALSAKTNAESAKTASENAKTLAETAKTQAESAKADAESAKTASENAKMLAETAKTQAETAKTDAISAKTAAENAKTAAVTAKTQAESAKAGAESAKDNAEGYAKQSEAWACETINGEPVPASESQYQNSAKHYANAASDSAVAARTAAGHYPYIGNNGNWYVWDVSTSAFVDTGHAAQGPAGETQDISGKADKVSNAASGNFAALDGNGNLLDSGSKPGDFLTEHQDISGKQAKITANGILKSDGNGNVSTATPGMDYGTYSKPATGIPATDLADGVIPELTDLIDDTAGDGNTNKVWSADKSDEEISGLSDEINNTQNDVADLQNSKAPIIFDTTSGAIASFPDGADDLPVEHLVASIEPVQSGSGDPAPDNIRPITGWTGLTVNQTSKNIVNISPSTLFYRNITTTPNATGNYYSIVDGAVTIYAVTAAAIMVCFKVLEVTRNLVGTQISLSLSETGTGDTAIMLADLNGENRTSSKSSPYTITESDVGKMIGVRVRVNNFVSQYTVRNIMVEFGSSVTTYEPHSGSTYIVDWMDEAGTVYGGTLDISTGLLIADKAKVSITKGEFGAKFSGTIMDYYDSRPNYSPTASGVNWNTARQQQISNIALIANPNSESTYGNYVAVVYTLANSPTLAKLRVSEYLYDTLSDNDTVEICYKLANPIIYQLTPTEVKTLLGQNHVFADTGDVEITYRADMKLFCQKNDTVDDVQINGSSVVVSGVANIPVASDTAAGVVKLSSSYGLWHKNAPEEDVIRIAAASVAQVKSGSSSYMPIVPANMHASAFYGLAKVAGVDLANENVTIGTYSDAAKVAIQKMLGIYEAPWELIREDTVTNATEADIEVTVDENEQPFELTDIRIQFWLPTQDVQAGKGDYGRIKLYYGNNSFDNLYIGSWTQNANATGKGGYALLEQEGRLITKVCSSNQTSGGNANLAGRVSLAKSGGMFEFPSSKRIYTRIVFTAVTGKANYVIYGRRKWTA